MKSITYQDIAKLKPEIEKIAMDYGLDFFPVIFELVDYDTVSQLAAYGGFPVRYPHWRFGMEYDQLSKGYRYGLQKIYEMVINTNPCYAYLMKSNPVVDQKLVMAHVYAHCDFFKNNFYFSHTNRKMIDEMANHAIRVRRYIDLHGLENVENFIDICLTLENLIDYHSPYIKRKLAHKEAARETAPKAVKKLRSKRYMEKYINPPEFIEAQMKELQERQSSHHNFPESPERDVLLFLIENAPLESWQQDILEIIPPGKLAAGYSGNYSRRGLLFCTPGDDQNHERGMGNLLAFYHYDPKIIASLGSGRLCRAPFRNHCQSPGTPESLPDGGIAAEGY